MRLGRASTSFSDNWRIELVRNTHADDAVTERLPGCIPNRPEEQLDTAFRRLSDLRPPAASGDSKEKSKKHRRLFWRCYSYGFNGARAPSHPNFQQFIFAPSIWNCTKYDSNLVGQITSGFCVGLPPILKLVHVHFFRFNRKYMKSTSF